jgi:DNA-binding PadR family transcriptional regulator
MDVKTICLGILSFGDATGYEIKKKLEGPFHHFYDASFGSIYPALGKLTDEGLVLRAEQAQDKRPDKKVYSVTSKGRMALLDELAKPPGPDRIRSNFLATLLFADALEPRLIDDLIGARIATHRRTLAELDNIASHSDAGSAFVCGYGVAIHEAALKYLEDQRHKIVGERLRVAPEAS